MVAPTLTEEQYAAAAKAAASNAASTEQVISITDLISEGPIEGLVLGGKSIFLNDDSIFADIETSFTATSGISISGTAGNTTVTVNDYTDDEFDYTTEAGQLGTRFLLIHNVFNFVETAGGTTITFNNNSAASETGFILQLNGDFTTDTAGNSFPNTITTTKKQIRQSNFEDGDGIVEVWSQSGDRYVTGMLLPFTDANPKSSGIRINLNVGDLENSSWLSDGGNLTVRVSEIRSITSISGSTITLATGPYTTFTNFSFSISEPIYSSAGTNPYYYNNRKIPSSGYQFRPGTVDQEPIENLTGDVGVSTVNIPASNARTLECATRQNITFTSDPAAEIDSVRLVFTYPSGLYNINKDNGDKGQAGVGYVLRLFTRDRNETTFTDRGYFPAQDRIGADAKGLRAQFTRSDVQGPTLQIGTNSGALMNPTGHTGLFIPMDDLTAQNPNENIITVNNQEYIDVLANETPFIKHGGKHLSGVTFTHTFDLTPYQPFTGFRISIVRITHSENNTEDNSGRAHDFPTIGFRHSDQTYQGIHQGGIAQAIGVITDRIHYPYSAYCQTTFNSRQFSSLPSRTYECYGLKVLVPDNYMTREEHGALTNSHTNLKPGVEVVGGFPDSNRLYGLHTFKDGTQSSSALFTGTFRKEKVYTDNPAWVFYDILTNNRYGVGEFVKDSDIDMFSLYRIARFCDELVPDGEGGHEPRFRANIYLTKATDCYKVLKDMATIFRGLLYWMDGQLTAVIDEKKTPVYTFNRSNVIGGEFAYEQTANKTRKNQIVVSWNNPENQFKLEPLFVEDRENIIKTGKVVKSAAVAFGCTSRGQAVRFGRWKLWTSINQTEVVSFSTAINAIFLVPGDIINVQDNHDYGFAYGGRVQSISRNSSTEISTITLDRNLGQTLDGSSHSDSINTTATNPFVLALLLAEKTVILNEDHPTNLSLTTGSTITTWTDADGNSIVVDTGGSNSDGSWTEEDFEKFTREAYSGGELLNLSYTKATRIKEVSCSNSASDISGGTNSITTTAGELTEAEVESALAGGIWALKDDSRDDHATRASYKQYKILSVVQEDDGNQYNITAVEYYPGKFDSIETNFTTTLPDTVFPTDAPTSVLKPPRGLRLLRTPDMNKPGEEAIIQWTPPENDEAIIGYEVTTGIPGQPEVIASTGTSIVLENIPDGNYVIHVRSKDAQGRTSAPAMIEANILDFYSGSHPRLFGALKGGIVNTRSVITTGPGQANKKFKFATNPVVLYSPTETKDTGQNVTVDGLDYSILSTFRDSSTYPWWNVSPSTLLDEEAFVVVRDYNNPIQSQRQLRLVNHVTDPRTSVDYWYDQSKQIQKIYNIQEPNLPEFDGNPDIWTALQGTVTIDNESSRVEGVNTAFTSLELTNVLKFTDDRMARITFIESDEVLFIDRAFSYKSNTITSLNVFQTTGAITYFTGQEEHGYRVGDIVKISGIVAGGGGIFNYDSAEITEVIANPANPNVFNAFKIDKLTPNPATAFMSNTSGTVTDALTGVIAYKDELSLDFRKDFLLGKLKHNGNFRSFLTIDPDITGNRDALVDSTVAFIRYDSDENQLTRLVGGAVRPLYNDITLTVTAIGFDDPEFKITGTGFQLVSSSEDTNFVSGTAGVYSRVVDDGVNLINFAGGADLDFTVVVREKQDETQQVTKTFSILKVKDGAAGTQGFTVNLNAEDYSIIYNPVGTTPQHNGTGNTIVLTADAFNFTDPLFRFTDASGTVSNWADYTGTQATLNFTVPTTFTSGVFANSSSVVFKVEVAEKPDGWTTSTAQNIPTTSATDSISIFKVKEGTGGFSIVNSNTSHVVATDKFGNLGTGTSAVAAGSGTTIEVFSGGEVLDFVGNLGAGATGKATAGDLAENEWYIKSVDAAGGDITLGSISETNDIVTVSDHSIHNSTNNFPSEDTEVIKYEIEAKVGDKIVTGETFQTIAKSKAGADGAVIVELYYRNNDSTGPGIAAPTGATFNFETKVLGGTLGQWVTTQPSPISTAKFVWKISATVSDDKSGTAIAIPQSAWSTENSLVAQFSSPGDNARAIRLKQSTSIIRYDKDDSTTIESGTATSINFAVDIQGPPGVTETPPSVSGLKLNFLVDGATVVSGAAVNTTGGNFATATQFTLPVAGNAQAVLPTIATDPVKNVTVQLIEPVDGSEVTVAEDTVSIYAVNSGSDSITPFLTNQVHVEPANSDGHLTDGLVSGKIDGAGGVFKIFKAGQFLTSGVTFSIVGSATTGGLTAAINSAGAYTLTPASGLSAEGLSTGWTTRSATFTFRATVDGQNFDLEYTINKSIEGQKGDDAVFLTASHVSFSPATSGNLFTPSGTSTVVLNTGNNTVTNISFAVASSDASKCSVSSSGSTATVTFNSISETNAQAGATITCSFTLNGVASSRSIKIPTTVHGLQGSNGAKTVTGHIYFTTSNASFSYSGGTATFNPSTGLITTSTVSNVPSGTTISNTPPTISPTASTAQFYFVSTYSGTEDLTNNTFTVNVGAAVSYFNFNGIVTFTNNSDGNAVLSEAGSGGGLTAIDGDNIATGSIDANRLQIGQTTGASRILLEDDVIKVFSGDATTPRIKIGNLNS